MSKKARMNKLEKAADEASLKLPLLVLKQDLANETLFHNEELGISVYEDSDRYTKLEETHDIIQIVYIADWPPGGAL